MTRIAHGEILIDVEDREAIQALRRIDSEFDRTMDKIDRESAEATATLNTAEFDQEVKNLKRELRRLEGLKASPDFDADDKEFKRKLRDVKRQIKEADGMRAEMELSVKGEDEILKAQKKIADNNRKIEQEIERAATRRWNNMQREARRRAGLRRQEAQELRQAERLAHSEEAARNRAAAAIKREQQALPKLRSEYVKLLTTVENFDRMRRKAVRSSDAHAVLQVDVDHEKALARMRVIREELKKAGEPIDLEANVHPGRDFGERVRTGLLAGGWSRAFTTAGQEAGNRFVFGFRDRASRLNKENILAAGGAMLSRGLSRMGSFFESLSNATVRLGPFTATIRQALVGLAAFGPIILDIVGSLGALVGVVGSAAGGLGALSVGFLGGAIPAALGFFAVLKPLTAQFGSAMKASKAYREALMKGKTDLAAKKLEELRAVLGNVDKETVKNFKNAGNLAGRWEKLTAPSRASAFNVIGKGLKYAGDNMGWFSDKTNKGFAVAEKGISRWIKGLDSAEGRNVLGNMMDNFNESLGPVLDGLGNVGTYLGRVGSVASNFLPGFAGQFKRWSQSMADGAANTGKLQQRVQGWVDSLRSVGRFLLSGGRLMKAFFGAGVGEGRRFLDTMTQAMNRWTAFLQTTEGRQGVQDFFKTSVSGAQALYSALAPIARAFVGWSESLSPIVTGLLKGVGAVGNFVSAVLRLTALTGPVQALAATLGALWAVGKIGAAIQAVGNFTRALLGLKAAQTGLAAANARGAVAGVGAAAGIGAAQTAATARMMTGTNRAMNSTSQTAAKATQNVGRFRGALSRVAPIAGGAVTALTGLNPVVGSIVIGAGAAGFALYKWHTRARDWEGSLRSNTAAAKTYASAVQALPQLHSDVAGSYIAEKQAALGVKQAQEQVNALRRAGMTNTDDYKSALLNLRSAQHSVYIRQQQTKTAMQQEAKAVQQTTKAAEGRVKTARAAVNAWKDDGSGAVKKFVQEQENNRLREGLTLKQKMKQVDEEYGEQMGEWYREGAPILERLRSAEGRLNEARAQGKLALLNQQRAAKGLVPIQQQAAKAFADLEKRGGKKITKEIALKFPDPNKAAQVGKAAGNALKAGVPKTQTTRIIADSKTAEEAIRRLNRAKIANKRMKIIMEGGDRAFAMIRRLVGAKLAPKVMRILGSDASARTKIAQLRALGIDPKTLRILGDIAHAMSMKRRMDAQKMRELVQAVKRQWTNAGDSGPPVPSILQRVQRIFSGKPGSLKGDAAGGTFAAGGVSAATGATPDDLRIARAAREADRRATREMRQGGRVNRPTILAGEENRTEFVIATNPRYKERSKALLMAAARALGIGKELRGSGDRDRINAATGYAPSLDVPDYSSMGTFSNKRTQKKFNALKGKRKNKFAAARNNPWAARLAALDTKQSDLEREVGLRQAAVREPDDFVIEHKNPTTGDVTYSFDKPTYDRWKADMYNVRAAVVALMQTVKEIVETIPKARSYADMQIAGNKRNIGTLKGEIGRVNKTRPRTDDGKRRKSARLERLNKALSKQRDQLRTRTEFRGALGERAKEAGFDWREFGQQAADIDFEIGDKKADTDKDIATQNASTSTTGGTSDQLSYGQQVAAAAAEKMAVMRDFGSNVVSNVGAATAAAATGGTSTGGAAPRMLNTNTMSAAVGSIAPSGSPSVGGAAIGSLGTGSAGAAAASTLGSSAGATAAGSQAVASGVGAQPAGDTNVSIVNNYESQPADPHTFSKGIEWELGALL